MTADYSKQKQTAACSPGCNMYDGAGWWIPRACGASRPGCRAGPRHVQQQDLQNFLSAELQSEGRPRGSPGLADQSQWTCIWPCTIVQDHLTSLRPDLWGACMPTAHLEAQHDRHALHAKRHVVGPSWSGMGYLAYQPQKQAFHLQSRQVPDQGSGVAEQCKASFRCTG